MSQHDAASTVDAALAAARITVLPEEREIFINDYPVLRSNADKLYGFSDVLEPAVEYDPLTYYPAPISE